MTTWLTRSVAVLFLVLPFVPVVADDPDDAEIARLVKQLGSTDFRTREAATKRLKEIGQPALDALGEAKAPLEARRRAEQISDAILDKLHPEHAIGDSVATVVVSADGKRLLTGGYDNALRLWDADTGKELRVFEGHTDAVRGVALSPDGKRVLSGSGDGTVRLWDAATGKELGRYEDCGFVWSVAFGPEGKAISTDILGRMYLWDLHTGKKVGVFACHSHPAGLDATREQLGSPFSSSRPGTNVAHSEKAKLAVTYGLYQPIRLWNLETGKEVRRFLQREAAYVCFSPDGKRLAGGFNHKGFLGLRIWDVGSGGELLGEPVARPEWPIFVAFSPNGKRIVTSNSDKTLRILDATSGKELYKSEGHAAYVRSAAFFPDGKRIASLISDYRGDTTVRIWRAPVTSKTRTRGERQ
jgi:WD40 repeat protein